MSNNITLAQVASMADDAWINDPVHCILQVQSQKTSKAGKPFWPCSLTDANDPSSPVLTTTLFADPSRYSGKLVSLEGKGNKKTSYNNKAQINMGKAGFIKVLSDANGAAPQAAQHSPPVPNATPQPTRTTPVNVVNGQSIGMAVKEAHLSILKSGQPLTEDAIVSLAGIFLRASSRLERGEHMQQASQPVKRPQPGANGQVQNNESDFDESNQPPF